MPSDEFSRNVLVDSDYPRLRLTRHGVVELSLNEWRRSLSTLTPLHNPCETSEHPDAAPCRAQFLRLAPRHEDLFGSAIDESETVSRGKVSDEIPSPDLDLPYPIVTCPLVSAIVRRQMIELFGLFDTLLENERRLALTSPAELSPTPYSVEPRAPERD